MNANCFWCWGNSNWSTLLKRKKLLEHFQNTTTGLTAMKIMCERTSGLSVWFRLEKYNNLAQIIKFYLKPTFFKLATRAKLHNRPKYRDASAAHALQGKSDRHLRTPELWGEKYRKRWNADGLKIKFMLTWHFWQIADKILRRVLCWK